MTCARLKIASFEPSVGINLPGWVEPDAEAAANPGGDRLAELGQALGERVLRRLVDAREQRLADQSRSSLTRVADAEVDQLHPTGGDTPFRLLEPNEGVRADGREDGEIGTASDGTDDEGGQLLKRPLELP